MKDCLCLLTISLEKQTSFWLIHYGSIWLAYCLGCQVTWIFLSFHMTWVIFLFNQNKTKDKRNFFPSILDVLQQGWEEREVTWHRKETDLISWARSVLLWQSINLVEWSGGAATLMIFPLSPFRSLLTHEVSTAEEKSARVKSQHQSITSCQNR